MMISRPILILVFFCYGLAFFSMGQIVALESRGGSDERLRHALRPLAAFGIIHGLHEWLEMFLMLEVLPFFTGGELLWEGIRVALLSFSFLSLAAFGASLLSPNPSIRRLSLLLPLVQATLWSLGLLIMRGRFTVDSGLWDVADVWTRYILGIPASLVACAGLIAQQRAFRLAGMAQFGRDSLWAAISLAWYGLVGQLFTRYSPLPPSTFLNQNLFLVLFGFPVQVLRAVAAGAAAAFVVRFLRAFEVENLQKMAALNAARLQAAEDREALRGDLLRQVVGAQEAERQRVARELHDETGQALTAIGLGLRGVARQVRSDKDNARPRLQQLEALVSHSLTELQRLIADLRPSHLDDLGLPAALRWYAGEIETRTGMPVVLEVRGPTRPISAPVKIALFRVAQEALNNAVKHAGPTEVCMELDFGEKEVSLSLRDNGIGFDPQQKDGGRRSSWGLIGMRERASLLGGEFHIESAPGRGTLVRVRIPYQTNNYGMQVEKSDEDPIAVGG